MMQHLGAMGKFTKSHSGGKMERKLCGLSSGLKIDLR